MLQVVLRGPFSLCRSYQDPKQEEEEEEEDEEDEDSDSQDEPSVSVALCCIANYTNTHVSLRP